MDNKFRWNMFMTSFLPLWISIIVSDIWSISASLVKLWDDNETCLNNIENAIQNNIVGICVTVVILCFSVFSVVSTNAFIKEQQSVEPKPKIKVVDAKRANKLSSEFLLAYILPMIAFDFTELKSVVLFFIYFGMLAFLCIRNNNVYTNILFELKGYKMYQCELESKKMGQVYTYKECLVISKENLTIHIGNEIKYWDFDNYIYLKLR